MNDSDNIKALLPIICPHCGEHNVIDLIISASLLNKEDTDKVLNNISDTPVIHDQDSEDKV